MNFDELQQAWARQSVAAPAPNTTQLRDLLGREVRQRHRGVRRIIGVATFVFVTAWGVGLTAHFTGIKPFNLVTLTTFLVASGFDLGCLVVALRTLRAMRAEALGMGDTLIAAQQASLRAVERQIRDCRFFGSALALGVLGNLAMTTVHFLTGNTPRIGMVANIAFTLVFALGVAVTLRRYYRDQLLPRRAALQRELAELQ